MVLAIAVEPWPLEVTAEGVVRVGGTRVTLDTVVIAFKQGNAPEEIAEQYPVLQLSDIYSTIGYYLRHRAEVEAYLAERERQAAILRREAEQRFNPNGLCGRLLARRNQQG